MEVTLCTRIWVSLHVQTLYRTVSSMINYSKAIKLLYHVKNPEVVQLFGGNMDKLNPTLLPSPRTLVSSYLAIRADIRYTFSLFHGKLHYGHPDFLNALYMYMSTCGVSIVVSRRCRCRLDSGQRSSPKQSNGTISIRWLRHK